jgi:glycosyltransferase involved in cell wall biosynthesis
MRILVVSSIMPPEIGGPASYVPEIINRLGNKHEFKVVTFTPSAEKVRGVETISVSQTGGTIGRQLRLVKIVLQKGSWADVIYAQDPLVVGLAANLAAFLVNKPVVIKFVGDPAWEEAFGKGITTKFLDDFLKDPSDAGWWGKLNILLTRISFILAKKIITPSKYIGSVVTGPYKINPAKVVPIYNAIEIPKIVKLKKENKIFTIVTPMGRLVKWKKVDEVIKAVSLINKNKVKVKLLVLGDGPESDSLKELARGENVEFLGKKTREEGLRILANSDLFVLNSVYEGLPHTVLEAFAVGTPVVATDIPGTNEIAINNQTALTIKPGDTDGLVKAIENIKNDHKLVRKLTFSGFRLVSSRFGWEANLRLLNQIFGK